MKSEDVEKLERLLNGPTFNRLSVEEREWIVAMLGSEERFSTLQKIEIDLNGSAYRSEIEPDKHTIDSLKTRMRNQSSRVPVWYSFLFIKMPAYAVALLVVFSSALVAWISQTPQSPKRFREAAVIKRDTVYVSKVDTVFREKVIYRQVRAVMPSFEEIQTARAVEKVPPVSTGVSMKDKEELNKLLVSGSD